MIRGIHLNVKTKRFQSSAVNKRALWQKGIFTRHTPTIDNESSCESSNPVNPDSDSEPPNADR